MRSRWRTACFSLVLFVGVLFFCEALLSIAYFRQVSTGTSALGVYSRKLVQIAYSRLAPIGVYDEDPVLGYRHQTNVQGKHRTLDFSVTYTLNEEGNRVIPQPEEAEGRILFVGGSYTFGHGVEDEEVFPSILARKFWPRWSVVNRAVPGYGTAHSYLVLKEAFESDNPPDVVIYPFLNGHIVRNYINATWIDALSTYGRRHPHFEIESGQLTFKGVVGIEEAKPASDEVSATERQLTQLMVREMQSLCGQNGVEFFLVLLPGERWPPSLVASFYQLKHPPVDLSNIRLEGFGNDGHPNSDDHRNLAERIGQSGITEFLQGRETETSTQTE